MASLILDTGALIALDRGDRRLWTTLDEANLASVVVLVPVGALAQAWRGGPRQARLSRALKKCEEVHIDGLTASELGELCGKTGTEDIIDASVAITTARAARRGTVAVFTSDRGDIAPLLAALNTPVNVVDV